METIQIDSPQKVTSFSLSLQNMYQPSFYLQSRGKRSSLKTWTLGTFRTMTEEKWPSFCRLHVSLLQKLVSLHVLFVMLLLKWSLGLVNIGLWSKIRKNGWDFFAEILKTAGHTNTAACSTGHHPFLLWESLITKFNKVSSPSSFSALSSLVVFLSSKVEKILACSTEFESQNEKNTHAHTLKKPNLHQGLKNPEQILQPEIIDPLQSNRNWRWVIL